jgi:hypothetical protein
MNKQIMAAILSVSNRDIINLSPIIPEDQQLLQQMVQKYRPDSLYYEDSWGYIVQATRYHGMKWYDPHTNSLIFFGRKSETDPTLVVPDFFATPEVLTRIIKTVQETSNAQKTILKNINPDDIPLFTPYGFRLYRNDEYWCQEARFDDQTYSQLIIDLKKITKKSGREYHPLRKALNKKPCLFIKKYNERNKDAILEMLILKDGNNINSKEKEKGMYYVSHAMYPMTNLDKFVIMNESNKLIGFTATSNITSKTIALVASIFKPKVPIHTVNNIKDSRNYIASIWGIYQTLLIKYNEGSQLINLGGCETINPHTFLKRTFYPIKKLSKIHLIYDNSQSS